MPLSKEQIKVNAHISDEEVLQDILDTQAEFDSTSPIAEMYRKAGDKLSIMKASTLEKTNIEREEFIKTLRELLDARKQLREQDTQA